MINRRTADTHEEAVSTVEEIAAAIERLTPGEVARVRAWLVEHAERLWDEQIERDERSGRMDILIDRALEEHRAGRTRVRRGGIR